MLMDAPQMPVPLVGVQPAQVGYLWPYLRPWFDLVEKSAKGRETAADLRHGVEEGSLQLWVWWPRPDEITAVCITEVILDPGVKVCRIRVCVGRDRSEWLALALPVIEAWAKSIDCGIVEPIARIGWERDLKKLGYRKNHLIMGKKVA
jgi:hypothetical protein